MLHPIGLASDDVKLVLNNNSVPGYGHTHVHKDWKILCRTQALLRNWSLLRQALLWISLSFRGSERIFFTALSSRVLHTYDEFGNRARVVLFSGSPITRRSQCCMHADKSKFSSGSSTIDCGSMFAGKWDHQSEWAEGRWNLSRQSKKQTVYSTCWESATFSPRGICLFSPFKSSVVIESNTNRIICSMENTKIKARRACKLFFTKKAGERKKKLVGSSKPHTFSMCFPWLRTDAKIV